MEREIYSIIYIKNNRLPESSASLEECGIIAGQYAVYRLDLLTNKRTAIDPALPQEDAAVLVMPSRK